MPVAKYEQKPFQLPGEGMRRGTLAEVKELGPQMTPSGEEKDKVRFIWELDEVDSSGSPLKVFETFNLTLHPQSFLYAAVRDIIGRDPGTSLELNSLLGIECDLVIKHNHNEQTGRTYANVVSHFRPKTKAEAAEEQRVSSAVQRVKQAAASPPITAAPPANADITDDDIPF